MDRFFLNVFEQNDLFDPGFNAAGEAFMAAIGHPMAMSSLDMDPRQIMFSNFIVARPAFRRSRLTLNQQPFAIYTGPESPLHGALTHATA